MCRVAVLVSISSRPAETQNGAHYNAQDAFLPVVQWVWRGRIFTYWLNQFSRTCMFALRAYNCLQLFILLVPVRLTQKNLRGVKH